jgi:taurine dioxygenase
LEVTDLGPSLPFGAAVTGLTLAHLEDQDLRKRLVDLWIERGVLLFRGESTSELQVELSRCFGTLERHPFKEARVEGAPELTHANYLPENGTAYKIDGQALGGWLPWHSDLVYVDKINRGGILRPVRLPETGGLTGFVDQIAAYDRLPQAIKDRIEDWSVVYAMDQNIERMRFGAPGAVKSIRKSKTYLGIMRREYEYPRVLHPMVYRQPETGRKVLNISPWFAMGIYELGGHEGEALLAEIVEICTDPASAYFHEWRLGDMVLWDNWRTLHCSTGVPLDQTRLMQRTTISGDYALGRKLEQRAEAPEPLDG